MTNGIARLVFITLHFLTTVKIYLYYLSIRTFLSRLAASVLIIARLHCRKSVHKPRKFDLVHQTVSPRERVGSGDETSGKVRETSVAIVHGYVFLFCLFLFIYLKFFFF